MFIVIEIQTNAAASELPVHSAVLLTNDGLMLRNESYSHEVTE